jgi:hypothetical protein
MFGLEYGLAQQAFPDLFSEALRNASVPPGAVPTPVPVAPVDPFGLTATAPQPEMIAPSMSPMAAPMPATLLPQAPPPPPSMLPQEQMTLTQMVPMQTQAPPQQPEPRAIAGEQPVIAEPPKRVAPLPGAGAVLAAGTGTPQTPKPWQYGDPFEFTPPGYNAPIPNAKYDPTTGVLTYEHPLTKRPFQITANETAPAMRSIYDEAVKKYDSLVQSLQAKPMASIDDDEETMYPYQYDPQYPAYVTLTTPQGDIPVRVTDLAQYRKGTIDPTIKTNYEGYLRQPFDENRKVFGDPSVLEYTNQQGLKVPTLMAGADPSVINRVLDNKEAYNGVKIVVAGYNDDGIPIFKGQYSPDTPSATQMRVDAEVKSLNETIIPQTLNRINARNNPDIKTSRDEILQQVKKDLDLAKAEYDAIASDPAATAADIKSKEDAYKNKKKEYDDTLGGSSTSTAIGATTGAINTTGIPTTIVTNVLPDRSGVSQSLYDGRVKTPEEFGEEFLAQLRYSAPDAVAINPAQTYQPTLTSAQSLLSQASQDMIEQLGDQARDVFTRAPAKFSYMLNGSPVVEEMPLNEAYSYLNQAWEDFLRTGDYRPVNRALARFTGMVDLNDPQTGYSMGWESEAYNQIPPSFTYDTAGPGFGQTMRTDMQFGPKMIVDEKRELIKPDNLGGAVKPPSPPKGPPVKKRPWRSSIKLPGSPRSVLFQPGTSLYRAIQTGYGLDTLAAQRALKEALNSTAYQERIRDAGNAYLDATKQTDAESRVVSAIHTVNGEYYKPGAKAMREGYSKALYAQWFKGYGFLSNSYSSADFVKDSEGLYNGSMSPDAFIKKYALKYSDWAKSPMAQVWQHSVNTGINNVPTTKAYEQLMNLIALYAHSLKNKAPIKDAGGKTFAPLGTYDAGGVTSFMMAPAAGSASGKISDFKDETERKAYEDSLKAAKLPTVATGTPDPGAAFGLMGVQDGDEQDFINSIFTVLPGLGDPQGEVIGRDAPEDISTRQLDANDTDLEYEKHRDGVESMKPMLTWIINAGVLGGPRDAKQRFIGKKP